MPSSLWYYQDANHQRVGPVSAEAVHEAVRNGTLSSASLVWREGMADWVPLQAAAAEIGLPMPPGSSLPPAFPGESVAPRERMVLPSAGRDPSLDEVVPAGFVRRWAALFIDGLVLIVPVMLVVFGVALGLGLSGMDGGALGQEGAESPLLTLTVYAVYFLASALYFAGMESSRHQATLGKMALGIKVTDNAGRPLTLSHALGRWFATALSYLTLYIGFLMAAFTERKRALHDMVSGTLVVDRWAYTESPERQKRSLPGCLVAFVVGVFLIIPIGAIFAAIAISQYQDYVIRSQVSEGPALADGVKTAIAEYYTAKGAYPMTHGDAGLVAPASISGSYVGAVDFGGGQGVIRVIYSARPPQKANASIDGMVLEMTPLVANGEMRWSCQSSTLKQKFCPAMCRCL